ncbi:hypothetical protein EZH22_14010 [Xanthobacter dioxanivorans]|uniref:Uncharacterized protein n=1 Tax=Xanthobacter dioxanivorans TaxID=2528964 RepID=A0A974PT12_9HYPH|nr:hypothetical protein [Xanthobacter dioxanivorans]QRG09267.1 hypothetical protein EZH22_14010 [Xanthobacter dioxanivorans]
MSVVDCIDKLVKTGQITRQIADEALGLYERSRGEFGRTMGPASAEAAAGLAAARALESSAKRLKNDTATQALAWANAERRVLSHPKGRVAGVMSMLTRDIWEAGGENVATKGEVIWAQLSAKFGQALEAYSPGIAGQSRQQIAGVRNLVRELFDVETGDGMAKAAAAGWKAAEKEGTDRILAAGRNVPLADAWRLPQFWDTLRVRAFTREEFKADFAAELDRGALTLWDRDTGAPAKADRRDFVLERAYRDITVGDSASTAFSPEQRTFQFADGAAGAEAWLRLQEKYGSGQNVFGVLTGHLQRMANEIALAEVIGPNHGAIVRAALTLAKEEEAGLSRWQRLNPLRMLESRSIAERAYDVLTGRANAVDGPLMAGFFGGLRSLNVASKLGGAIVSAIPGDSVTTALAASYNGMDPGRILTGVIREISRGGEESRQIAARLQLTAHAAMDSAHSFVRFAGEASGPQILRAMATTVIRAQGLAWWTDTMKRVFTMEFTGHLADHAGHSLDALRKVDAPLANFLDRHQISAKEWDTIRAGAPLEVEGARFLDTEAIGDRALREKLLGAMIEERAFAVLEPDARIRAVMTGGTTAGTFWGEMVRSATLFKSFSMTMVATHLMRLATQGPIEQRVWNGAAFVLFNLLAGAAAIQARAVLYGKTPEAMDTPGFWVRSGLQSGSLGVYGDLINASTSRTGRSPVSDLAGPAIGAAEDVARLSSQQLRRLMEGADTTFGAEAVRTARRYDPSLWYTRLAVDRLLFDQIQTLVDPDYRASFRRSEKAAQRDFGQSYWWAPGDALPRGVR